MVPLFALLSCGADPVIECPKGDVYGQHLWESKPQYSCLDEVCINEVCSNCGLERTWWTESTWREHVGARVYVYKSVKYGDFRDWRAEWEDEFGKRQVEKIHYVDKIKKIK